MLDSWPYRTIDVSASLREQYLDHWQHPWILPTESRMRFSELCLSAFIFFSFFGELCKPFNYVGCDADCNVIIRHVNFGTLTCWKNSLANRNLRVLLPLLSCYI